MLARYLIEQQLLELKTSVMKASFIAASAFYLSCKIMKQPAWSKRLAAACKYSENELTSCAKKLLILLQTAPTVSLQHIKKKYAQEKYCRISDLEVTSLKLNHIM